MDTGSIQLQPSELPRLQAAAPTVGGAVSQLPASTEAAGGGFADLLGEALRAVNSQQHQADLAAQRVATGDAEDLHEAIIAMEKAELTLRLTAQVTQRAIEAYKEIAHMQL